jgi:hypothetical protein
MSEAPGSSRTDFHLGVAVAIVAALVAIVDLVGGHIGDEELLATEEKVSAYLWYQSKGIKESQAEGQRDLLRALVVGGAVSAEHRAEIDALVASNAADVARYGQEKRAILEGGTVDGTPVNGARSFEHRAQSLSRVGDLLDVAMLFLHLALLLGGVGVAVAHKQLERALLRIVIVAAALGVVIAAASGIVWLAA